MLKIHTQLKLFSKIAVFLTASAQAQVGNIQSLQLWNERTQSVVPGFESLQNGAVIDIAGLPRDALNFALNVSPTKVGSSQFWVNGLPGYIESSAPYTSFKEEQAQVVEGSFDIIANTYEKSKAQGKVGVASRWTFTVIDSAQNSPLPPEILKVNVKGIRVRGEANRNVRSYLKYGATAQDLNLSTSLSAGTSIGFDIAIPKISGAPETHFKVVVRDSRDRETASDILYVTHPKYVYPGTDWVSMTPESQNVNSAQLKNAMDVLTKHMATDQTLIVRGGYAIWKGPRYTKRSGMASATKTVTSTMLGVLVNRGIVKTTDPVSLTYPGGPNHLWKHYAAMTVNKKFSYNTYMNEYAKMLTYVADEDLFPLFMRHIGNKIGMNNNFEWRPGQQTNRIRGHIIREGAGLNGVTSSASDWGRLCYLYMRGGNWNGEQLLDAQYVKEATTNQSVGSGWGAGRYGYNMWLNTKNHLPDATPKAFWSWGRGGRTCIALPEWDMIVVRVGAGVNDGWNLPNEFFRELKKAIADL